MDNLHSYRRDLPHFRSDGATYWVTWRLSADRAELTEAARDIVMAALNYREGEEYRLTAFVVMDDHVHVIVKPLPGFSLEKIVQAWKSVSAHRINKLLDTTGSVWQPEYLDRIFRDEEELLQKCEYVLNNPAKRWPGQTDYRWVYCTLLA